MLFFYPKYRKLYESKESVTNSFGLHSKKLLKQAKIDVSSIATNDIPDVPIWDSKHVSVDFSLSEFDKSSTSSDVFMSKFNELKLKYNGFCEMYTDGSKVGEKVACAVLTDCGVLSYRLPNGCSIFTAELEAINKAIMFAGVSWRKHFVIYSDSLSALQAIHSQESKNPQVNIVLQACQDLIKKGNHIEFFWVPSHRNIPGNEKADRAAKAALSKLMLPTFKIPSTDSFTKIHKLVSSLWQSRWDEQVNNKLHSIMPSINESYYSGCKNRKDDIIISRLRIGHTRLTHSHLMEKKPRPKCDFCPEDQELSVKHILLECSHFSHKRRRRFQVDDLRQLFTTVPSRIIIDFVKDIGLYNSL